MSAHVIEVISQRPEGIVEVECLTCTQNAFGYTEESAREILERVMRSDLDKLDASDLSSYGIDASVDEVPPYFAWKHDRLREHFSA